MGEHSKNWVEIGKSKENGQVGTQGKGRTHREKTQNKGRLADPQALIRID